MKLVLAAVAAVGITSVVATVVIGGRMREDTVVANPYEAGVRWDEEHGHHAATRSPAPPPSPLPPLRAGGGGENEGTSTSTSTAIATATSTSTATCNATAGACTVAAGDLAVTLDLGPRPLRTMSDLALVVQVREGAAPTSGATVEVSFTMPGMFMGENRAVLAAAGPGRYAGRGVLVRCASGRKDYTAEVILRRPGRPPARASFDFRVAE